MNLFSPQNIKKILNQYGAKPSKFLGQNFLINPSVVDRIISVAQLTKEDTVLEIGPGLGTLTQALAQKVKKVIAIEKDPFMVTILKETLVDYPNVTILHDDILKTPLHTHGLVAGEYKVVANIPYYITAILIRTLLESTHHPSMMVLMIQKEVAQRICAKPGDLNLLAVSVQFYGQPTIAISVPKSSFWPSPKIDSAVIKIDTIRKQPTMVDSALFFQIVKAGFSHPRKQLINNLSSSLQQPKEFIHEWLSHNHISTKERAENIDLPTWYCLTNTFPQ